MLDKMLNPWKIIHATPIYENAWIGLTEFKVITPTGAPGIYGKVHFKNHATGIVPLDAQGNTYLVGQFRFPTDQYSWEIPEGGCLYEKETIEAAAARELLEETGLIANKWTKILHMHLSNSVSDEASTIFVAQDLVQLQPQPEETEVLQIKKLPFEEVYQMVLREEITDAMSVAAILKVKLLLLNQTL